MTWLRSLIMLAVFGVAATGCSSSSTSNSNNPDANSNVQNNKSPDEQFADLKLQYTSLTDAERRGEQGKKLIADIGLLSTKLSEQARSEAGRILASHNFTQFAEKMNQEGGPRFPLDPNTGKPIDPTTIPLPNLKDFDPTKIPAKVNLPDGKLPEFPALPDFRIDPTKITNPTKTPELKLPFDPTKLPELKFPVDPTKVPELKLPEFPSLQDTPKPKKND